MLTIAIALASIGVSVTSILLRRRSQHRTQQALDELQRSQAETGRLIAEASAELDAANAEMDEALRQLERQIAELGITIPKRDTPTMSHHDQILTPDEDQQVADFLAAAYADSRNDIEPETALRESLGYRVESVADLVRDATDPDDLNLSCWLCYGRLDIQDNSHWAQIDYHGRQMCDACANRLENALHSGAVTSLTPDEQAPLIPYAIQPQDSLAAQRMRRHYANALGWLELITAKQP